MHATSIRLLILASAVTAAFGADPAPLQPLPSSSFGAALIRMLGSLAIVVAIFFAGAWLFRNLHRFRAQNAPQRRLQVFEARSLGARQTLYVVGFDQQRMLIGSSPQGLTLIAHLPGGAPEPAAERTAAERIVPVPFGEALMQALGRK
jgi:flagellar protein FliO/FliZ